MLHPCTDPALVPLLHRACLWVNTERTTHYAPRDNIMIRKELGSYFFLFAVFGEGRSICTTFPDT